ncbi:protein angel homolog 2-like [Epargyreus clarus]|uniref:protein angel homolog 2-like n=1 Tax=Epargyreus clarus TaxID=520877 RepID=UPI003C2AE9B4
MSVPPWVHRHVIFESRQTVGNNIIKTYNQCVIINCPYGASCPVAFPQQVTFWPAHYPPNPIIPMNLMPRHPQFSPRPSIALPQSNDIIEINAPFEMGVQNEININLDINPIDSNRSWQYNTCENQAGSEKTMSFKIMSYNVLSQMILDSNMITYTSCRQENLVWEVRWQRIFNEVLCVNPDIFCLQEVHLSHLPYYARFQTIGYLGVFKKKSRYKSDGCAVFYRASMFEMIDKMAVEFRHEVIPILRADNIGVIVKLAPYASPSTRLVVATTHLLFTGADATRLAQTRILLNELEKFSQDETRGQLPVILCGDLNSFPNSKVIKFLEEGQICIPWGESLEQIGLAEDIIEFYSGQQVASFDGINSSNYVATNVMRCKIATHSFKLSSVYDTDKDHERWETVDHIYYTNNDMRVTQRLGPPTTCMRRKIPNEVYGSDHLSIAASFEMVIE